MDNYDKNYSHVNVTMLAAVGHLLVITRFVAVADWLPFNPTTRTVVPQATKRMPIVGYAA